MGKTSIQIFLWRENAEKTTKFALNRHYLPFLLNLYTSLFISHQGIILNMRT